MCRQVDWVDARTKPGMWVQTKHSDPNQGHQHKPRSRGSVAESKTANRKKREKKKRSRGFSTLFFSIWHLEAAAAVC